MPEDYLGDVIGDLNQRRGRILGIDTAGRLQRLTALVPQLIGIMLYHALIESKASEHSARMVAMKNATDKTREITKTLTLAYNKERQAVITAEVSEITGGLEAMKV